MRMESRQSLEKLGAIANLTNALVAQMTELLKLREAVQKAEEARDRKTAKQRHHEIISTAYRTKAAALEMAAQTKHRLVTRRDNDAFPRSVARATDVTLSEHRSEARNGTIKSKARPGRLFMQSQWR
jgi:DNA gyrase/topoisomerase IV subunit B